MAENGTDWDKWEAILTGVEKGTGILGSLFGDDDSDASQKEASRQRSRELLLELVLSSAQTRQENEERRGRFEASAPLVRNLIERLHGPGRSSVARTRPRTYQARDAEGNLVEGVATEPGGQAASPEELSQLMPDFEAFRAQRERARQMASGITADNLFSAREDPLAAVERMDPELISKLRRISGLGSERGSSGREGGIPGGGLFDLLGKGKTAYDVAKWAGLVGGGSGAAAAGGSAAAALPAAIPAVPGGVAAGGAAAGSAALPTVASPALPGVAGVGGGSASGVAGGSAAASGVPGGLAAQATGAALPFIGAAGITMGGDLLMDLLGFGESLQEKRLRMWGDTLPPESENERRWRRMNQEKKKKLPESVRRAREEEEILRMMSQGPEYL